MKDFGQEHRTSFPAAILFDSDTAAFLLADSHRRILELQAALSLRRQEADASRQAVVATGSAIRTGASIQTTSSLRRGTGHQSKHKLKLFQTQFSERVQSSVGPFQDAGLTGGRN